MNKFQIEKTGPASVRFSALVSKHESAGARNAFMAAVSESPAAYNAFRAEQEAIEAAGDQAVVRFRATTTQLEAKDVFKMAQEKREAYNRGRKLGII